MQTTNSIFMSSHGTNLLFFYNIPKLQAITNKLQVHYISWTHSHTCTSPLLTPTAKYFPFSAHDRLDTYKSSSASSTSCVTLHSEAFHKNTACPKATANTFWRLQSNVLRSVITYSMIDIQSLWKLKISKEWFGSKVYLKYSR